MNALERPDDQNGEIRDQNRQVKTVGLIDAAKRILVEDFVEKLRYRVRGGQQNGKKKWMHNFDSDQKKPRAAVKNAVIAAIKLPLPENRPSPRPFNLAAMPDRDRDQVINTTIIHLQQGVRTGFYGKERLIIFVAVINQAYLTVGIQFRPNSQPASSARTDCGFSRALILKVLRAWRSKVIGIPNDNHQHQTNFHNLRLFIDIKG